MNVDQLTESLHATSVPTPLDLDRVTRDGRRIRTRRRAVLAGGLAAAVAAVALPVGLGEPDAATSGFAGSPTPSARDAFDDARERAFEADAPVAAPRAGVLELDRKFYLGGDKVRSVGGLAVWDDPEGLGFGARLVDGDGSLRKAGALDLAALSGDGEILARVPFQNATEPTFVGLVDAPAGTRPRDVVVRVESVDSAVEKGVRLDVVPGKALVWVGATDGTEAGIELVRWSLRLRDGEVLARGTFEGPTSGAWESMR